MEPEIGLGAKIRKGKAGGEAREEIGAQLAGDPAEGSEMKLDALNGGFIVLVFARAGCRLDETQFPSLFINILPTHHFC